MWEKPLREEELRAIQAFRQEDWDGLLALAREQTVTGLLYRAVALLPDEVNVPDSTIQQLVFETDRIQRRYRAVAGVSDRVMQVISSRGFHPVILKGSTCAARYPQPDLREAGDIDIYLPPEEFDAAVAGLGNTEAAPDGSWHYTMEGVDIDLHRRYFDLHVKPDRLPQVPSPEAELLMLSSHILKHAAGTGVGLRQCCDMATAIHSIRVEPETMERWYHSTDTWRWNKLLYSFLEDHFHLASPYPKENSAPLQHILLKGGNFGHYAPARNRELQRTPLHRKAGTAFRLLRRLPFSLHYAPREAIPLIMELTIGNAKAGRK